MFDLSGGLWGLEGIDIDGDGSADMFAQDIDVDGAADIVSFDTDGDGISDVFSMDVTDVFYEDIDGDGLSDVTKVFDMDGDGLGDLYLTNYALDPFAVPDIGGDVLPDVVSFDTDGDGTIDSLIFKEGNEYSEVFDVSAVVDESDSMSFDNEISLYQNDIDDYNSQAVYNASNLEQFDPYAYDAGDIIGDPGAAMEVFHPQETDSSCAVAAQEFVLDQLTGHDFSEAELRELAEIYGWYGPGEGTTFYNMGNILTECGLVVQRSYGGTMDDIANCLDNGGGVVVAVDIYELYDIDVPGEGANHAIQVIGIDQSDPANPMVIVNDSGMANGGGLMIPMDSFINAWEDSDCLIVQAYKNA